MPSPQAAICTESASFGLFLTLVIEPGGEAAARRAAAALSELTQRLAGELAEPALVSALGIGAAVWPRLVGGTAPSGLAPFRAIADGPRRAPSTPADLFVHIHSPRHDANFALARAMMGMLGPRARVIEEIHGFRNRGGRDLTGFVDGTENP